MLSLILLSSLALAGEPTRCVASIPMPTAACGLRGEFVVTAGGRTEAAATKAARSALTEALSKSVAHLLRAQPAATVDASACAASVADAHVDCFPDATLSQSRYCFVTLTDDRCWEKEVLTVEDVGWKVYSRGTAEMCKAVDARLVAQGFNDVETRRVECAASCLKATTVSCP